MSAALALTVAFEGHEFSTYLFEEKPAWIAGDVGENLDYTIEGFQKSLDQWDELLEGSDFEVLRGNRLAAFKVTLPPTVRTTVGRASHLKILRESGLHLVLTKTEKPAGRRLRRLLADEVLPKLMRGETVGPTLAKSSPITNLDTVTFEALLAKIGNDVAERFRRVIARVDEIAAVVERHAEHPERFASYARVGDAEDATKLRARIEKVACAHKVRFARVEGIVRREYAVPGYLKLPTKLVADVVARLDDLFLAKALPPTRRAKKPEPVNPKQVGLFDFFEEKKKRTRKRREPQKLDRDDDGGPEGNAS